MRPLLTRQQGRASQLPGFRKKKGGGNHGREMWLHGIFLMFLLSPEPPLKKS